MNAPNPSTAISRAFVDELLRNGVEHVVFAPGSRSTALVLACLDERRLTCHVEIDERSAGFFALGVGKAGRHPAAVITTSGTAAANLAPAVVEADMACVPLLVLTADRPPELRHTGANQTIDQVKLYGDRIRWFCEVGVAEDTPVANAYWRSTVCRAVSEATAARPGPVHLNLAFREPLVPLSDDGRASAQPFENEISGRPGGAPWTVDRRYGRPEGGSLSLDGRVLMVIGDGGPEAPEQAWPVVAEGHSSQRIAGTISTAHHLLADSRFVDSHVPDVVVTVGRVGLSRNLARVIASASRHVVVDPTNWADPDRRASEFVAQLPRPGAVDPEWRSMWLEADAVAREAIDGFLDAIDRPCEPRIARDTAEAEPPGSTLYVSSSMPVRDLDWFMRPKPIRVLANRGASGLDGFVSSALGAASIDGPVTALCGDLSLLHDQNGFLLAERPDCVFVVVNNDGGGIFSFLPQARIEEHFERGFGTPHGRSMAAIAGLHDLTYAGIDSARELTPAIRRAAAAGGVHLIELDTDRSENVSIHASVTAVVGEALRARGL